MPSPTDESAIAEIRTKLKELFVANMGLEDITPEQEYYIGRSVAAIILTKYPPLTNQPANEYLNILGQTLAQGVSLSLDVQWQPAENLTTFAFGNYGETGTVQQGRTWNRGGTNAGCGLRPRRCVCRPADGDQGRRRSMRRSLEDKRKR